VVNRMLKDERVGTPPSSAVVNDVLYDAADGLVEAVYDLLAQQDENDQGKGQPGQGQPGQGQPGQGQPGDGDGEGDLVPSGTEAEAEQLADEWRIATVQAAMHAAKAGKLSAAVKRLIGDMLNPKVDWRDVLRAFMTKARTDERTLARPNRRFMSQGLYLPSVTGETMGPVVVAIDCSGSINGPLLNMFAAEVRALHDDLKPASTHVVYFDASVCHVDEFSPDDQVTVQPHGGGGTAFSPIFKYIDDHGLEPVACVVLTDLECYDYGPTPGYPVLWCSTTGKHPVPFGDVVAM
jgi:predicted metal-dependent peptidase